MQQMMKSAGMDFVPPDVLAGIGLLVVAFVLWRFAVVNIKMLIGTAVVIALALAAWHGYLRMHS